MRLKFIGCLMLLLHVASGYGQGIKVVASVSSAEVAVGEQFELKFSTDGSPESFNPPSFSGFQVVGGPNQSSSFSSINGNTTINMSVGYILVGVREGTYTIGAATMLIGGRTYRSNPVRVKVVKGSGRAPGGQSGNSAAAGSPDDVVPGGNAGDIAGKLFLRAVTSKNNVYQGEQITVSYKLYTNVGIVDNNVDKLPDFNGFWSQEIKNPNPNVEWKVEDYNGRMYHVAVLKQVILFPERFGKLVLDPLSMTFIVRQVVPSNDPIEQFFGGGSYKDSKYKIKSAPVTINVRPLPEAGRPEGFQGAVGRFSVGATLDKPSLRANEAMNYTVKIKGTGNLKLLKAPELKLAADIEKYDPKVTDNITESVDGVSGSREYSYLLIPRHAGHYKIDELKFSYFDPAAAKYVTLVTGSFPVKVDKAAPGSQVNAYGGQQDVKVVDKDIRYIKTDGSLDADGPRFYGSPLFFVLLFLGPLGFAAALIYRSWSREQNRDQVKVKGRNAGKVAARHLANAEIQLQTGNKPAFYEAVYRGLYGYLSDKLDIRIAELSREKIAGQLMLKGIDTGLLDRLNSTLDLCEMARYAPVSGIAEREVFEKAKMIISDIESHV